MPQSAAALVIGNELLTGKIEEKNVAYLARTLFRLGVELRRVVICRDHVPTIAEDIRTLGATHDWLFTSGGVGPTHDDMTIEAVALAFDVPVVRSPEVEALIRGHYAERTTSAHLRMADMPEGAELFRTKTLPWPTIVMGNVAVLPGIPEIFKMKLVALEERLATSTSFVSQAVYTQCDEGELADLLGRLDAAHPGVSVGSYPKIKDPEYKVKITFDGTDAQAVRATADEFVAAIAPHKLVRRE